MRTIIDIEKDKLHALSILAEKEHVSRAFLIRKAIDSFLQSSKNQEIKRDVFGILKDKTQLEGLTFQRKLRSEWDE